MDVTDFHRFISYTYIILSDLLIHAHTYSYIFNKSAMTRLFPIKPLFFVAS